MGGVGQAGEASMKMVVSGGTTPGEDGPVYRARIRPIELKDAQELDGALIPGLAAGGLQQGAGTITPLYRRTGRPSYWNCPRLPPES